MRPAARKASLITLPMPLLRASTGLGAAAASIRLSCAAMRGAVATSLHERRPSEPAPEPRYVQCGRDANVEHKGAGCPPTFDRFHVDRPAMAHSGDIVCFDKRPAACIAPDAPAVPAMAFRCSRLNGELMNAAPLRDDTIRI